MAKEESAAPRLRFPEFRNAAAWNVAKLGAIATILKGKGIAKADVIDGGRHPCIRYGELYTRYGEVIDTVYSRTNAPLEELILSAKNDVIIPSSGETKMDIATASCVLHDGVALGSDLNIIRTTVDGPFLSYQLNGAKRAEIARVAQGDTVVHLYASQLREVSLAVPEGNEQCKIASCLTTLDEVIAAQTQKIDALKTHKRGLMEQLFPCEGETVPRLRFPEFRDAPEWSEETLGSVGVMKAGAFIPASSIAGQRTNDFPFPCYGGNGLRGFAKAPTHSGKFALIGRQGALCGNVLLVDGRFHATEHALVVTPARNIGVEWLYYVLTVLDLNQFSIGQAQPGLSVTVLEKVPVMIALDVREQTRIADCLSSIDADITAASDQLAALKTHKAGLMQQLFPQPDAL